MMAKDKDDCEIWLPSQFLTDDELLMDYKINSRSGFNPFGTHSYLSSPVGSVTGPSVDTESDEELYIAELTRKIAQSTLQDSGFCYQNSKGLSLSASPQSTLCGCTLGPSTYPLAPKSFKQSLGSLNSNQASFFYQELQVAQFQRLKQQQMMNQSQEKGLLGSGKGGFRQYSVNQNHQNLVQSRGQNGIAARPPMNGSVSGWPMLQQPSPPPSPLPGSGMRAVFLGNDHRGPKKECAGTGVFLPRTTVTQTESCKKKGCATVLLPERVVQALNLDLEAMDARPQPQVQAKCYNGARRGLNSISAPTYRINIGATQQKRNVTTENTYSQPMSQELLLPQDWTY